MSSASRSCILLYVSETVCRFVSVIFSSFFLLPQLTPPRLLPNTKTKRDLRQDLIVVPVSALLLIEYGGISRLGGDWRGTEQLLFWLFKTNIISSDSVWKKKKGRYTTICRRNWQCTHVRSHTHTHEVEEEREEMLTAFTFTLQWGFFFFFFFLLLLPSFPLVGKQMTTSPSIPS